MSRTLVTETMILILFMSLLAGYSANSEDDEAFNDAATLVGIEVGHLKFYGYLLC